MFTRALAFLKRIHRESKELSPEIALINIRRIYTGSALAIILHIIQISAFVFSSDNVRFWKEFIIIINVSMLCVWLAAFLISRKLRNDTEPSKFSYFYQYALVCLLFLYGILITSFDQIVSNNITPFILVSLIFGTAFIAKPYYSLLILISSYFAFFFGVNIYNQPFDVLLSNRMNGLTATAISFFISVILWRNTHINLMQKLRIHNQQEQLEKVNRELEKMAYYDSLTGLPNRRYFDDVVKKEIALNRRKGFESCLIMIDLDLFKRINDEHGHPIGDKLLKHIGKLLLKNLRKYDSICRLGGEEFIILLPQTNIKQAKAVAENLRYIIENASFELGKSKINITASFGISALDFNDEDALMHSYTQADNALYLAKQSGRNCVKTAL